jgi:hypothetical protein
VFLILSVNYCQKLFPNSPLPPTVTNFTNITQSRPHFAQHFNIADTDDYIPAYDYDYSIAYQCQSKGDTPLNREFIAASIIHVTNGVMFALYWVPYFKKHPETPLWRRVLLLVPEFLNIIEASLYIKSASMYGVASQTCRDYTCDMKLEMHKLETIASVLEMFASIGWFYSWYTTFPPGPGRGLTLWDPDFLAAIGLIVPSILYVVYNVENSFTPLDIPTNNLYLVADVIYTFDAVIYLIAALRDAEFFWWLKVVPGCVKEKGNAELYASVSPSSLLEYAHDLPDQSAVGYHGQATLNRPVAG